MDTSLFLLRQLARRVYKKISTSSLSFFNIVGQPMRRRRAQGRQQLWKAAHDRRRKARCAFRPPAPSTICAPAFSRRRHRWCCPPWYGWPHPCRFSICRRLPIVWSRFRWPTACSLVPLSAWSWLLSWWLMDRDRVHPNSAGYIVRHPETNECELVNIWRVTEKNTCGYFVTAPPLTARQR